MADIDLLLSAINRQAMKTVVIDFSNLDDMSGFGEIARNYCPRLAAATVSDMHFVFIVPEKHKGEYGSHIDYVAREHLKQEIKAYSITTLPSLRHIPSSL